MTFRTSGILRYNVSQFQQAATYWMIFPERHAREAAR